MCNNIRVICPCVVILELSVHYLQEKLKTNEHARVSFKFLKQVECIYAGSKLLFRQGTTRGIGLVTSITPFKECTER